MHERSQNSLVLQQLQDLASNFFLDLKRHHPHLKKALVRDFDTLLERSNHEGVPFLTQTLPLISKALIRTFETGTFLCPIGFKKAKGTALPRFCGGLLKSVLDEKGRLLKDFDQCSANDVIQLCNLFYKLELPYSEKLESKVIDNFKEVEHELSKLVLAHDSILQEAAGLVKRVLKGFDPFEITPRHGPGAVATGERFEEKWDFKRKYKAIHKVYPYYDYFTPSRNSLLSEISSYRKYELLDSGCARVILVPKDSRGPRLISMEPLEYQFIQQGISRSLVGHIESKGNLACGHVNFTDQSVNRRLALENSLSGEYATLDMKEASDRVTVELVRHLFSQRRDVLRALLATRTTHTELPNGELIQLSKFAPMGSALCFPVEALSFWALAESFRRRARIKGQVYVYGDDIIVPRKLAPILLKFFPKYGLKFNSDKCFTRGWFRESCGMDAIRGIQCTPVRMRHLLPQSRKEVSLLAAAVEFSNHLWERGFWNSATFVSDFCEKVQHIGILRHPKLNFGGLSYVSFTIKGVIIDSALRVRFKKGLQRHEVYSPGLYSVKKDAIWLRSSRLFANLVGLGGLDSDRHTVPHAVSLKMRWMPILGNVA